MAELTTIYRFTQEYTGLHRVNRRSDRLVIQHEGERPYYLNPANGYRCSVKMVEELLSHNLIAKVNGNDEGEETRQTKSADVLSLQEHFIPTLENQNFITKKEEIDPFIIAMNSNKISREEYEAALKTVQAYKKQLEAELMATIQEVRDIEVKPVILTHIDDLDLSVRAYNCLTRANLTTVAAILEYGPEQLLELPAMGRRSFNEVKQALKELGIKY